MTNEQLQLAIDMHEAGVTWWLIAVYFKTNYNTLKRRIKKYEETLERIL